MGSLEFVVGSLDALADHIQDLANRDGMDWRDQDPKVVLMAIVAELGEAYNVLKTHSIYDMWYWNGKPEGFNVELTDALLGILILLKRDPKWEQKFIAKVRYREEHGWPGQHELDSNQS